MGSESENRKIIVIYNSPQRAKINSGIESEESALDTAVAVTKALRTKNWDAKLIGISQPIIKIIEMIVEEKAAAIFNLCEGSGVNSSLEMNMAALWSLLGIPYTGCGPKTLALAQDKIIAKLLLKSSGIPTPAYEVFYNSSQKTALPFPLIVKPPLEDGSFGITAKSVVTNKRNLNLAVEKIISKYKTPALVEKYIDGREIHVPVVGAKNIDVLPPSETNFSALPEHLPKITTYAAKWLPQTKIFRNTPSICPAKISKSLHQKLINLSKKIYKVFGANAYGRIDFRCDRKGRIFVLEFNPNPDISLDAGFAKALNAARIDFADFVENQVVLALKNREKKNEI
jgi:D-alanine-D-alanine ligase